MLFDRIRELKERLREEGRQEGREEGRELGRTQAKRDSVLRLLHGRFENLPEAVVSQISAIEDTARLDTIFDQAITAEHLDDINWRNGAD